MRVVIDTNVLLVTIPRRSRLRAIFDAFINSRFTLVITTNIYFEYLEILQKHGGIGTVAYFKDLVNAADNVLMPEVYYYWNLHN